MKRLKLFLMFFCSSIAICIGQVTHNVLPMRYAAIDDTLKIQSCLSFFEYRMKAHDPDVCELIFDSTVHIGATAFTNARIKDLIYGYFNSTDTTGMAVEYSNKPKPYMADFSILSISYDFNVGTNSVGTNSYVGNSIRPVGDTVVVRLSIKVGSSDPPIACSIVMRKNSESYSVPNYDYVILRMPDYSLLEAISSYAHNDLMTFSGKNGSIPDQWRDDGGFKSWDFLNDEPKPCETLLTGFTVSNNSLIPIPINVQANGQTYSFPIINSTVTQERLNRKLFADVSDFGVFAAPDDSKHLLIALDSYWNRMITAQLSGGIIGSCPHFDNPDTPSYGFVFKNLALMDVSNNKDIFIFDNDIFNDNKVMNHFVYNLLEPGYLSGGSCSATPFPDTLILTSFKKSDVQLWNYYQTPVTLYPTIIASAGGFTYGAFGLFFYQGSTSSSYPNPPAYTFNFSNPAQKYFGYKLPLCNTEKKFFTLPIFDCSGRYVLEGARSFGSKSLSIYDGKAFIYTDFNPGLLYGTSGNNHSYLPTRSVTKVSTSYVNLTDVYRNDDGVSILTDRPNKLLHIFDSYNGEYVCSYGPPAGTDFSKLRAVRYVENWGGGSGNPPYCDLYVSQDWTETTGFMRFYEDVEFLNVRRVLEGKSLVPDVIDFTITNRCSFDVYLFDGAYERIRKRRILMGPTRQNRLSVYNPNRYVIILKVRPENPYYVADKVYYIHPDGTVIHKVQYRDKPIDVAPYAFVYPNPAYGYTNIVYYTLRNDKIEILIYDNLGRKVLSLFNGYCESGFNTYRLDASGLANGLYYFRIVGVENSTVGKINVVK